MTTMDIQFVVILSPIIALLVYSVIDMVRT